MGQITLTKGHKESDAFDAGDIQCKAFDFFVVQQVHILFADTLKGVLAFDFHWLGFDPMTVFPVGAVGRNFADVDFRVKVGGKGIAVVAAVAVQDVDVVDFIKLVF